MKLKREDIVIKEKISLPASKSISNRVLLISALAGDAYNICNLAKCDDVTSMQTVLHTLKTQTQQETFDIGHAGTAMRFLTAYLAQLNGTWILTGSERMKQRPIAVLVDALKTLGADIAYLENDGFPPLRIKGKKLQGGTINISASISSQYVSALMMIAPYMQNGLELNLQGKIVSSTYINMTTEIMRTFGADIKINNNSINIASKPYSPTQFQVENDWSAASYFFEILAIAEQGETTLTNLFPNSLQGDSKQIELWAELGIKTLFTDDSNIILQASNKTVERLDLDFVNMPDLVQSFAVACCLKNIPFRFTGIETLRIKETDRVSALINELAKLGYHLTVEQDSALIWDGAKTSPHQTLSIATYHDHRMAMAFAPAILKYSPLCIEDENVVTKSFPNFWIELKK